jgi:hypothetical protein
MNHLPTVVPLHESTVLHEGGLAPSLARALTSLLLARSRRQSPHEILRVEWSADYRARLLIKNGGPGRAGIRPVHR